MDYKTDLPKYKHGCPTCTFLGHHSRLISTTETMAADLYYCDVGVLPTIIARFSDANDDYVSGIHVAIIALRSDRPFAAWPAYYFVLEALKRALARELLTGKHLSAYL
jgi:hypothetical protein